MTAQNAAVSAEVLAALAEIDGASDASPMLAELTTELKKEMMEKTKLVVLSIARDRAQVKDKRKEFKRKSEAALAKFNAALDEWDALFAKALAGDPEVLDEHYTKVEVLKAKTRCLSVIA